VPICNIRIDKLITIYITDRDGAIVLQASSDDMPARLLETSFTAAFLISNERLGKMGLGRNKSIVCRFEQYEIVQYLYDPFVLTLIGWNGANIGNLN
jgi:ragulator complex protein LAMTOR3